MKDIIFDQSCFTKVIVTFLRTIQPIFPNPGDSQPLNAGSYSYWSVITSGDLIA